MDRKSANQKIKSRLHALAALLIVLAATTQASAFSIRPEITKAADDIRNFEAPDRYPGDWFRQAATKMFSTPVHERATNMIYGCQGDEKDCNPRGKGKMAPAAVLAGAEWNDNPPFQLKSTSDAACKAYLGATVSAAVAPECWYVLFRDGEKGAAQGTYYDAGSGNVILYRVHYGDLQFLHSMANRDGEAPSATKKQIMMWAEFAYKTAKGDIKRGQPLNRTKIAGMTELFPKGETGQLLFLREDRTYQSDSDFKGFAFGTLIHMIEDSFSDSHAEREIPDGSLCGGAASTYPMPGRVKTFHSYARQDKDKHKAADSQAALNNGLAKIDPTAVTVGQTLKTMLESETDWQVVKSYLDCAYSLAEDAQASGPGEKYATAPRRTAANMGNGGNDAGTP